MKFTLTATDFDEEIRYGGRHEVAVVSSDAVPEATTVLANSFGTVRFREMALGVASILIGEHEMKKPVVLDGRIEEEMVEMHFNLGSAVSMREPGRPMVSAESMSHNLLGYQGIKGFVDFGRGRFFRTFDVHLSPGYVRKWYGQSCVLDRFISELEHGRTAMLYPRAMPVTPAMQDLIGQVANCPLTGFARRIYLESKVQELFALQIGLSHNMASTGDGGQSELSPADVERLHEAKRYIEENLASPKSIEELARICGTNRQKLKTGFRKLFGTTVFGHLQTCRMARARMLLQDGLPAGDVAHLVGYADHSSFSHAFRAYHGFSPGRTAANRKVFSFGG